MEKKHYKEFISLYSSLGDAGIIIGDIRFYTEKGKETILSTIEQKLKQFEIFGNEVSELELFGYFLPEGLMDEIENNFYELKDYAGTYLKQIITDFKNISPYLCINRKKEYVTDRLGRVVLKIGETTYSEKHVSTHKTLERHYLRIEPFLFYETATNAEKYVIACSKTYEEFFYQLDLLCLIFSIDLVEIQNKNNLQVWERFNTKKGQSNTEQLTRTCKHFSILEWATIFYYANETKLLPENRTIKKRMEQFISKHEIKTTFNHFKTSYYDAKKRIYDKHDFPIYKLNLILPFLREDYKQTVTKVENDIIYLKENATDYQ